MCWLKSSIVTIILRKIKDADPSGWNSEVQYQYSKKTSNTSLRPHIKRLHTALYNHLVKENGWENLVPGLVSRSRSQATSEVSQLGVRQLDDVDQQKFHQHLVKFIIADDQVCFRLSSLHSLTCVPLFQIPVPERRGMS